MTTTYAHPEVLVSTDWVKENLNAPGIKLVEIDVDTKAYDAGHIPGAVGFNWQTQLQDQVRRDIISKEAFEKLVGQASHRKIRSCFMATTTIGSRPTAFGCSRFMAIAKFASWMAGASSGSTNRI